MRKNALLLFIVPVFLLSFVSGCVDVPDEVLFPVSKIQVNIPIMEKSYELRESIEKDTSMIKFNYNQDDPSRLYYVNDTISIEKVTVDTNLSLDDFTSDFSQDIGSIKLNDIEPVSGDIMVDDWAEDVVPGQTQLFPQQQGTPTIEFEKIDQFENVTLDGGQMLFEIDNRLPVDIEFRGFTITNVAGGETVVDTNGVIPIAAESSVTLTFDMTGKFLENQLVWNGTIRSEGSNGQMVVVPDGAGTVITTSFQNLVIRNAYAPLPEQDPFRKDSTIVFDDSTLVKEAVFDEGTLQITFVNNFDMNIRVNMLMPELLEANGSSFQKTVSIPRNSDVKLYASPRSLTDWKIVSPGADPTDLLAYNVVVYTESTDDPRQITKTDKIDISVEMKDIVFESLDGQVKPTTFNIEKTSFEFDLEDFKDKFTFEGIEFGNPEIRMVLSSSANIDMLMNATLTGSNNSMSSSKPLDNILIEGNGSTAVNLSDYGLADLMSSFSGSFPDEFLISGDAVINPGYTQGSVTREDSITGNVKIEIPLNIAIQGGVLKDTVDFDLGDVDESDIEQINSGTIFIQLTNYIPAGFTFEGAVYDADNNVEVLALPPRGQVVQLPEPTINQEGDVTSPAVLDETNAISFQLTGDEIQTLIDHKNVIVNLKMQTPEGGTVPVKFRTTDKIELKIYARGSYTLDLNSDEE